MTVADIIVSINNSNVDKPFSYLVPDEFRGRILRGMRVVVPFGRGNKPIEGFVIDVREQETENDTSKLKSIINLPDKAPLFAEDLMLLAKWMQDKYYSTFAECIKCILPSGISIKTETVYYPNPIIDAELSEVEELIIDYALKNAPVTKLDFLNIENLQPKHVESLIRRGVLIKENLLSAKDFVRYERHVVLEDVAGDAQWPAEKTKQGVVISYLRASGLVSAKKVKADLNITDSPINSLVSKGFARYENVEIRRESVVGVKFSEPTGEALILNDEQQVALDAILSAKGNDEKKPILLHGVTGSGKTEVYLRAINEVLKGGKEAIVLVPEISLTPQTVGRFKDRFGERVGVTHSRMSMAERYDMWKNAVEGKVSIMIGPRSALFAPFKNLGIIIIDEEHENTYKSDTTPKYDARETAIWRAKLTKSLVVFGSATPSIESYTKALDGDYTMARMKNRVNKSMPRIDIIDMRQELEEGNRSMFSNELMEAIKSNLENGLQTILFLNRRGHSTFVSCRQCGFVVKCDECNINFTYHTYNDSMICHYCAAKTRAPKNCPQCGSKYIKYFGVGTQKVEDELQKLFGQAKILRMDMDSTREKGGHEKILAEFKNGNADILVGTQMIAKGLDFPKVTLVGVVAADLSLNTGDFRSAEKTFQLLTQVSGRSGRADYDGRVIIQTYNPEHYAIIHSGTADYEGFYEHEIALRRQMDYPPYSHLFEVMVTGESEKNLILVLQRLCDILYAYKATLCVSEELQPTGIARLLAEESSQRCGYDKTTALELIGPSPAMVSKIRNRYRWRLIVKAEDEQYLKKTILTCVDELRKTENVSDINISLTFDPY